LFSRGYKIVFFTNQNGIAQKKQRVGDLTGKILDIVEQLEFPIQAFMACAKDVYRKPNTTMWDIMAKNYNKGIVINTESSIYVGDAAGRAKDWQKGKPRDFAVTDRMFACNIGLPFATPEEFFLQQRAAPFQWRCSSPQDLLTRALANKRPFGYNGSSPIASDKQELVVCVGFPASGKSTFVKTHLIPRGYVWVNQDTLKTPAKCLKACCTALDEGSCVVIDNTNPKKETRNAYITEAKDRGIPVRCFNFTTDRHCALHLNLFREKMANGDKSRVPTVAFNTYKSKFQPPTKSEGFSEVVNIDFVPQLSDDERRIFLQFNE